MVLVPVVAVVSENQVRIYVFLDFFEEFLDFHPLIWEKAVAELLHHHCGSPLCLLEKKCRAGTGFALPLASGTEYHPNNIQIRIGGEQLQDSTAAANFDVVGVGPQTQHRKLARRIRGQV